jgi:hypothetical protein
MPTSSVGSLNSWGVYIIASAVLVGILSPQLIGVAGDSREAADWRNADGVRVALNALRPGITFTFSYGGWSTSDAVRLDGQQVSVTYGNGTISFPTIWSLPNCTLLPAVNYRVWLAGEIVQVKQAG